MKSNSRSLRIQDCTSKSPIRLAEVHNLKTILSWSYLENKDLHNIAVGNVNWYNYTENNWTTTIKVTNAYILWPSNYTSRNLYRHTLVQAMRKQLLQQCLLIIAKEWKLGRYPSTGELKNKILYIIQYTTNHKIELLYTWKKTKSALYPNTEIFPRIYCYMKKQEVE